MEGLCGNPALSKTIGAIFLTAVAHFASLSTQCCGHSHSISNFPIITLFIMEICYQ